MNPMHVVFPRKQLRNLNVVFSHAKAGWSLAEFEWRHDGGDDWRPRVGLRWNGTPNDLGAPQAGGYPTWFLLPEGIAAGAFLEIAGAVDALNTRRAAPQQPAAEA